jgi:hypothetical protein
MQMNKLLQAFVVWLRLADKSAVATINRALRLL